MWQSKRQPDLLAGLALGFLMCIPVFVQAADNGTKDSNAGTAVHFGYPQDWSSRHLVMTGNNDAATLKAGRTEPRYVYSMVRRRAAIEAATKGRRPHKNAMKVDWAVSLENGFVPADQSPAKFGFDVTTQSCNADYLLLGLTVSSGTQANLVGINNLYTGASPACNGGTPWVSFAYNTITQTGGQITTSPAISEHGFKTAFVETATAGSFFHVLVLPNPIPAPPSQTGTVLSPATPTSCATPVAAGCMTTVQISAGHTPTSPWIDYGADTAYVGTDDGKLYKISPVFGGGAPTVVADTNWPVTIGASGIVLTDPTVDDNAARIFIGDGIGNLYAIDLNNPAKTTSATIPVGWVTDSPPQNGIGIIDPPIVVNDSANPAIDQVFAFTGCSNVVGIGGAITQVPANFTSATVVDATNTADLGSSDGGGSCTLNNVHSGDFDNEFWMNGSTNGHIMACGFTSGGGAPSTPKMYMFPFTGGQLSNTPPTTSWLINNSKGDECSPLTEFFDGTTDRLFYGIGAAGNGFIKSSNITAGLPASSGCSNGNPTSTCVTAPHKLEGTSAIIVDNQVANGGTNLYFGTLARGSVNGQKCNIAGGNANPFCVVKLTQSTLQ